MSGRVAALIVSAIWCFAASGPAAAQPAGANDRLIAEIERIAATAGGTVGVAAIHLETGATVDFNSDMRFALASTFKLPVAAYAFAQAERGAISLVEPFPVAREDMIEPGILNEHFRHPGVAISTLNAIELSITQSDNGATDVIYDRIGGPSAVNSWLRANGFSEIYLGMQNVRETFADPAAPGVSELTPRTTTPRAMVRFLAELHSGQLLSPQSRTALLDIMSRTLGERISLQLPPGITVLHKTGTLFGQDGISVNDIGFILTPHGTIALAIYIKESPQEVSHAARDRVVGSISRSIYDYFMLCI